MGTESVAFFFPKATPYQQLGRRHERLQGAAEGASQDGKRARLYQSLGLVVVAQPAQRKELEAALGVGHAAHLGTPPAIVRELHPHQPALPARPATGEVGFAPSSA